ncbi:MAG: sulfatase-like hydrolase/transferase [Planctomycetota bacterium]
MSARPSRRRPLHLALLFAACTLALGFAHAADTADQPNILWIITDDQRLDSIEAFNRILTGQPDSALGPVESPNVDRLVAQGTTFINTHTQSSACAPSRAAMHSGRYPHRRGVYGFELHHNNNPEIYRPTVQDVLGANGYQTALAGKLGERTIGRDSNGWHWDQNRYHVHLGPSREMGLKGYTDWVKKPIWDSSINGVSGHEAHFFFDDGESVTYLEPTRTEWAPEDKQRYDEVSERLDLFPHATPTKGPGMFIGGVSSRSAGHTRDGYYVKALQDYLANPDRPYETPWGQAVQGPDSDRPIFFNLGFDFPHTPVLPPKSYRDRFHTYDYTIPQPAPGEVDAFPPQIMALYKQKRSDHFTPEQQLSMIRDYYAFCAYGDELVGQAFDAFVEYSEAQGRPWMVVYVCGDHGWRLNEHGMIAKFGPYALDTHNPMVVVSSDKQAFPAGKVVHDFTEFIDMAPTFYAAAGLDVDAPEFDHLDGYDLAKVVSGEAEPRDYVLNEGWWVTGPRATIRTKDYLFTMKVNPTRQAGDDMAWPLDKPLDAIEPMLFDLQADPGEVNNVAFDPAYAEVVAAMRNKLEDIVIRDGRLEVDWRKGLTGEVFRLEGIAPLYGGDDKKLNVPSVRKAERGAAGSP